MTTQTSFCKWSHFLPIGLIFLVSCASYTRLSLQQREQINAKYMAQTLWLKQSLYAGPFYEDDRYRLAHNKPFDQLTYLKALDGEVILPPPADEIIPMGTKVVIDRIEWPTGDRILRRPLFSPRYNPWVFMHLASKRTTKPYILLLPSDITDEASAHQAVRSMLSDQDQAGWLRSLEKKVQEAIVHKRPIIGMNNQELTASLGDPDHLVSRREPNSIKEIASFGSTVIILENGKVVNIEERKNNGDEK